MLSAKKKRNEVRVYTERVTHVLWDGEGGTQEKAVGQDLILKQMPK